MKKLNILYIGNNLAKKTKYLTTLENLSNQLSKENFNVIISSNKINKVIRIDTYSTTNFYYAFFTSQLSRLFKIKYIPILHGGNLPERIRKSSFF